MNLQRVVVIFPSFVFIMMFALYKVQELHEVRARVRKRKSLCGYAGIIAVKSRHACSISGPGNSLHYFSPYANPKSHSIQWVTEWDCLTAVMIKDY